VTATESPHTEPENVAHGYCIALYDALEERAEDGTFTGSITEVYKTLGISNQYYSRLVHALVEVGSVEHVQRGHHRRPSIYKLLERPTSEQLTALDSLTLRTKRAKVSDSDLHQRIANLERSVSNVNIVAALTNLERRLSALEKRK
jgi:hypothetical protein